MKIREIKEPGIYQRVDDKELYIIFEVYKNADKCWLNTDPKADLILDEWIYQSTDSNGCSHYSTNGDLKPIYQEKSDIEVSRIQDKKYKITEDGLGLIEEKPSYKELYMKYKQTLEDIQNYEKRNCEVCNFYNTEKCNSRCQVFVILNLIDKVKKD